MCFNLPLRNWYLRVQKSNNNKGEFYILNWELKSSLNGRLATESITFTVFAVQLKFFLITINIWRCTLFDKTCIHSFSAWNFPLRLCCRLLNSVDTHLYCDEFYPPKKENCYGKTTHENDGKWNLNDHNASWNRRLLLATRPLECDKKKTKMWSKLSTFASNAGDE
jgi:hypothetical protein